MLQKRRLRRKYIRRRSNMSHRQGTSNWYPCRTMIEHHLHMKQIHQSSSDRRRGTSTRSCNMSAKCLRRKCRKMDVRWTCNSFCFQGTSNGDPCTTMVQHLLRMKHIHHSSTSRCRGAANHPSRHACRNLRRHPRNGGRLTIAIHDTSVCHLRVIPPRHHLCWYGRQ